MRYKFTLWAKCLIIGIAVLANCQKRVLAPVPLAPEDMCSYCRMVISEKQYAAQLIDSESQAYKFDDIGCMVNFVKNKKNSANPVAYFVMDFNERQWLKADIAWFVHSSEIQSPMNGGLIAFKDQPAANAAAAKFHGKVLRFENLFE